MVQEWPPGSFLVDWVPAHKDEQYFRDHGISEDHRLGNDLADVAAKQAAKLHSMDNEQAIIFCGEAKLIKQRCLMAAKVHTVYLATVGKRLVLVPRKELALREGRAAKEAKAKRRHLMAWLPPKRRVTRKTAGRAVCTVCGAFAQGKDYLLNFSNQECQGPLL